MLSIKFLVLCVSVVFSITCVDDYYSYINTLLEQKNFKCTNEPTFSETNRCVNFVVDTDFSTEFADQYQTCLALDSDTTHSFYGYTYFTDYPEEYMEEMMLVKYVYSGSDQTSTAVPETTPMKSFSIIPTDYEGWGKAYSSNNPAIDQVINMSWVFSVKYVIDYWIAQYETAVGKPFGGSYIGFRINPQFILFCIAQNTEERKKGLYIEDIFNRINDKGIGAAYLPIHLVNCGEDSPLPLTNRFITQKIETGNRGGLMAMMNADFVPIVPIAFDLNTLRFVQHMSPTTDEPLLSSRTQPSMYAVLNAYNKNGAHGAYWEVITNVLPTMSVNLLLKMEDVTTNTNSHGIAAFAVGIKLDFSPVFDPSIRHECEELTYHPDCEQVVIDSSVCDDPSVTTLDLSNISLPEDAYGIYFPSEAGCSHVTDITLSVTDDLYCSFGANAISHRLFNKLLTICSVIEANSFTADPTLAVGGVNILGYVGIGEDRNTKVKSLRLHPGVYSGFTNITFVGFENLEVLEIGERDSTVASFNSVASISVQDCPKLLKFTTAGQSSFNQVTHLTVQTHEAKTITAADDDSCIVGSPVASSLVVNVKDSFAELYAIDIKYSHCFQHIRIEGDNSANEAGSVTILGMGGSIVEDITFAGSQSFIISNLIVNDQRSVSTISFIGNDIFTIPPSGCEIKKCPSLTEIEFMGNNIIRGSDTVETGLHLRLHVLAKLAQITMEGNNICKNINMLSVNHVGDSALAGITPLGIHISGSNNLLGFAGTVSGAYFQNVPVALLLTTSEVIPDPYPLSAFDLLLTLNVHSSTCGYLSGVMVGAEHSCY